MALFGSFLARIKKLKPEWEGPLLPAQSVEMQKGVIEKITIEESGSFLSHFGNKMWV
jgi:hypothetical protein